MAAYDFLIHTLNTSLIDWLIDLLTVTVVVVVDDGDVCELSLYAIAMSILTVQQAWRCYFNVSEEWRSNYGGIQIIVTAIITRPIVKVAIHSSVHEPLDSR